MTNCVEGSISVKERDFALGQRRQFLDRLSRSPEIIRGELEPVARLVTECCARIFDAERVSVWLFNETETELRCVDLFELTAARHSSGAVLLEHEFASEFQAMKSAFYVDAAEPLCDPRTAGYSESYLKPNRITALLDVVLRLGGRNLGTLCVEHVDRKHVWSQSEIDFACLVGLQLSVALERRELMRAEMARRDVQERLRANQELDELKNRFLGNVSHELRTPLTLLIGPTEDLLRSSDSLTKWQRDQIESVHRGGVRLLKQVNALLDFVALEGGRVHPTFEPTDLMAVTKELVSLFDASAVKAGLSLRFESDGLDEPIYVDRCMWEKMVVNLLSNALKFTLHGGVLVRLRATPTTVVLDVEDTGVGIPEEALPHLFRRFYRVKDSGGRSVEGTGIGLALVKELVQLHKGHVSVESVFGSGSTFRIELPRGRAHLPPDQVSEQPAPIRSSGTAAAIEEVQGWLPRRAEPPSDVACASVRTPAAPSSKSTGALRILVVDDNADMRAYLERLLVGHYDVETVPDGVEAMAAVHERCPDLVLTDLMMPRLDGLGLLRALRADASTKSIPIVFLSARAGEQAAVEALAVGADDYISKPFSARELLARVATHIELVRMRREAAESSLKDVFVGLAAHELRTPLASIKLRLELAQERLRDGSLEAAARHLSGARNAINRAETLSGELLSMSAVQSRKLELRKERTDLVAICREAAAEESASIGRPVTLALPEGPVEAFVDRERIFEVVKHLVSNALKFSPPELPVVLTLKEGGVEGDQALISVRDEAPGIPPEEVPNVFDRFHRVPGIEVQIGSRVGLGVGLYIARAIAELHGGRVDLETTLGRGSTFTLTIPRAIR